MQEKTIAEQMINDYGVSTKEFQGMCNSELLKYAVQKRMWCNGTKKLLDVRRTVAIEMTDKDGDTAWAAFTAEFFESTGAEAIKRAVLDPGTYTIEIYDGRLLFASAR